ncbi:MAG TPA: formyltransferase family protein [Phycisphaerales bacterium]|nr:formyltransferase family protein [Phycisphaerales bacterium]
MTTAMPTPTTPTSTSTGQAAPAASAEPAKSPYTHGGNAYIPAGASPRTTPLKKYVFIQDDPFFLTKVLDKYLREFGDTTVGINVQPNTQGKRTVVQTAMDLLKMYGPWYFQWKIRNYIWAKVKAKFFNGLLGSTKRCYTVAAVAKKYGVTVDYTSDVNSPEFRKMLRDRGVDFIVSISGTMLYKKLLREETPYGIVNCHGALLPKYRGLMPSFWTLANGETEGGVSVHFVDYKLDNGPIVVQKRYRIHAHDTLEDIMARSKDLAAEAIIECVRKVENAARRGVPPECTPNPEAELSHFSMPTKQDVDRFRTHGHRFF